MKQGSSNPMTYPPQRQITARAASPCAASQLGNAQSPRFGFLPPEPLLREVIPQPGGTGRINEGNNGSQKG